MGRYHFDGLSDSEVFAARNLHGTNALPPPAVETFWEKLIDNFKDPLIKILGVALGITCLLALFGYASWIEGIGIAAAVFLATFVATYSEHKNEESFQDLQRQASRRHANVFRCVPLLGSRQKPIRPQRHRSLFRAFKLLEPFSFRISIWSIPCKNAGDGQKRQFHTGNGAQFVALRGGISIFSGRFLLANLSGIRSDSRSCFV